MRQINIELTSIYRLTTNPKGLIDSVNIKIEYKINDKSTFGELKLFLNDQFNTSDFRNLLDVDTTNLSIPGCEKLEDDTLLSTHIQNDCLIIIYDIYLNQMPRKKSAEDIKNEELTQIIQQSLVDNHVSILNNNLIPPNSNHLKIIGAAVLCATALGCILLVKYKLGKSASVVMGTENLAMPSISTTTTAINFI